MVIINGSDDLLRVSAQLLDVGSVMNVVEEVNLAAILTLVRFGNLKNSILNLPEQRSSGPRYGQAERSVGSTLWFCLCHAWKLILIVQDVMRCESCG